MATKSYWSGFTTGALVGVATSLGAILFTNLRGRAGRSRIIRLEKSVQVGRPVEEVFEAWRQLERLPQLSNLIQNVRSEGNRSHWTVFVNGRKLEWDAEIEQFIPNQSIGWKSVGGLRHTGRISFSPIGSDTLVHVAMNYVPPSRLLRPLMAPMSGELEGYIESALRGFKRSVESGEAARLGQQEYATSPEQMRGTGTYGPPQAETSAPAPQAGPEYTAPPEASR